MLYSLSALWILPSSIILFSYYTGLIPLDAISVSLIIVIYSVIWFKIADKAVISFGIPRANLLRVEKLSEKLGLRNLDPRLAYYLDKWLRSTKETAEEIPKREMSVQLRRVMIPMSNQEGVRANDRISMREIYEGLMNIQIEEESSTPGGAEAITVSEENQADSEIPAMERDRGGLELDERYLSKIASIFSKKSGCLLIKALQLGEFRAKDLKERCNAHWQTVREWLSMGMELGILVEKDGYYQLDRERTRRILDRFLGGGERPD